MDDSPSPARVDIYAYANRAALDVIGAAGWLDAFPILQFMNDRDTSFFPQDLVMRSTLSSTVMTTSSPMHSVPSSGRPPESLCGKYSPRSFLSSKNWFVLSCATLKATGTMLITQ